MQLPRKLTAENGAKAALSGEFFETIEVPNPDYCGCMNCDYCLHNGYDEPMYITQKVPVTWTTIKAIWDKAVEHFEKELTNE